MSRHWYEYVLISFLTVATLGVCIFIATSDLEHTGNIYPNEAINPVIPYDVDLEAIKDVLAQSGVEDVSLLKRQSSYELFTPLDIREGQMITIKGLFFLKPDADLNSFQNTTSIVAKNKDGEPSKITVRLVGIPEGKIPKGKLVIAAFTGEIIRWNVSIDMNVEDVEVLGSADEMMNVVSKHWTKMGPELQNMTESKYLSKTSGDKLCDQESGGLVIRHSVFKWVGDEDHESQYITPFYVNVWYYVSLHAEITGIRVLYSTPRLSCTETLTQEQILKWTDDEAETMAIILSGEFQAPPELKQQIYDELALIRTTYGQEIPQLWCIRF